MADLTANHVLHVLDKVYHNVCHPSLKSDGEGSIPEIIALHGTFANTADDDDSDSSEDEDQKEEEVVIKFSFFMFLHGGVLSPDDGEGLDKVQPKAVKKKFKDRKDKDIDNDGDVDDSDKFLHKRRKAVSKAMAKEARQMMVYRVSSSKLQGNVHAKDEKEAEKILRRQQKEEMQEFATINDHILQEGVEDLTTETGRQRFFDNLRSLGIKSSKETRFSIAI